MIWNYVREQKPRATNRRRYRRHSMVQMRAEIDQTKAQVKDISETSVRVIGAPAWMVPGQGIGMRLIFQTPKKEIRIPIYGQVLRRSDVGMVVLYSRPLDYWSISFKTLIDAGNGLIRA
ncbi:MAG: hypothetical protein P1V34_09870 [Alphaproteobacteria bacterium]|nr:hypothetical protein [Alphaproteobacteria bacterium]